MFLEYDPDFNHSNAPLILVGCGGTGSEVAKIICRMLFHMRENRMDIPKTIRFVDPDIIEAKNVGRQAFAVQDIGRYKAEVLAERFSVAFGLDIEFYAEPFDAKKHTQNSWTHFDNRNVIIGAVDNYLGRRAINKAEHSIWIDSGNHHTNGQVVIGSTNELRHAYLLSNLEKNTIKCLPNVAAVYPELLQPEQKVQVVEEMSCAEAIALDTQHLLINQQMALVVGQYLYKLYFRQPIRTSETQVSIDPLVMKSKPILKADYIATEEAS
ncbi:MAG: ThiF family adenylyltransferase [Chloroflexota bacterium]